MTDTSPDQNPFDSPTAEEIPPENAAAKISRPNSIRPSWWELGLLVSLLALAIYLGGQSYLEALADDWPHAMLEDEASKYHMIITWMLGSVGGIMVLWRWHRGGLLRGPEPGHAMLLAMALGSILSLLAFLIILLVGGPGDGPGWEAGRPLMFGIISLVMNMIVVGLLWKYASWHSSALLIAVVTLLGLLLYIDWAFYLLDWITPGAVWPDTHIGLIRGYCIGWLIIAICIFWVSIQDHRKGIQRDWLHWIGLGCWFASTLVFYLIAST